MPKEKKISEEPIIGEDGKITLSMEQLYAMIDERAAQNAKSVVPHNVVSSYNVRDPKKIESINVRQFDGMFVMGFKNHQKNIYKKVPQYTFYGIIPGKGTKEPFLTLLLSNDGKNIVEKDVSTTDYMDNRDTYIAKVLEIKKEVITHNHGVLGQGGQFAGEVDEKYKNTVRPTHLMQSQETIQSFIVQLPGFDSTSEFKSDFLA